jgi:LemA protein
MSEATIKKIKLAGIGLILLFLILSVFQTKNKAISLEEAVETAHSDINVQEKKRADLVYNLVDTVQSYSQYEADTLNSIIAQRGAGNVTSAQIAAVVEAYPELKASEQYKTLMLELTTLENEISQYRTAYNSSVERYRRYVRSVIPSICLKITGYDVQQYNRLEYSDAGATAPQDLFSSSGTS